jgi:hypothetical protein
MYRRNEISNVKYYSALSILAGLLFSLGISTQPKISAHDERDVAGSLKGGATPARSAYGKTPLLFEANRGQTDSRAKFISHGKGCTLFLGGTEAVFSLETLDPANNDILRMRFAGANQASDVEGSGDAVTRTNYYKGKKWFENIPNYSRVTYSNLYKGVDAIFYGSAENQLEYDFVVAPGGDAGQIELGFEGAKNISINDEGELVIKTANAQLVHQKPYTYQEIEGQRHEIASRYVLSSDKTVKFETAEYDRSKTLVIDPKIGYLTYVGGSLGDEIHSIKLDAAGNAFVAGRTFSLDFPTPGSRSSANKSGIFVSKIAPDGQDLLFTTFLDGSDHEGFTVFQATGTEIALGPGGNVFVAGVTSSSDFPVSDNAYQKVRLCSRQYGSCTFDEEAFVTKLSPAGNIVYSTYLGGRHDDKANGIAVDSAGRAYVTGMTDSGVTFPTKNEFQGTGVFAYNEDAFLTVFKADGSDILYSTGLGGSGVDVANDIAIDSENNVYIGGETGSTNFPLKNAFQTTNRGNGDAFVAKFNTSNSGNASLQYSTFLGGTGFDEVNGITVDSDGKAHVAGETASTNFPLTNPLRSINQGGEAFVTVMGEFGNSIEASTFLGGGGADLANDIEIDEFEAIYITGTTNSTNYPLALPFQSTLGGQTDAFVTKFKFGAGILSSSYLGGSNFERGFSIALQNKRVLFVAGNSFSADLPTTPGVLKETNTNNIANGFIARILDTHLDSVGVFRPGSTFLLTQSTTNVVSQQATFTSALSGQRGVAGDWDGDGADSIGTFSNGSWTVRNFNFPLFALPPPFGIKNITFGAANDLPVVGDWNGDGIDTPGVFRPGTGQFTVTDSTATNPAFSLGVTRVNFGDAGDLPIAGDWDGDGKDSVAVYRPGTGETFFTNADISNKFAPIVTLSPGIDFVAFLGVAEDLPFAGDWNGDGVDSLGLWRPSTTEMILSDDNVGLRAVFPFGLGTDQPIAGDWDGKPNP